MTEATRTCDLAALVEGQPRAAFVGGVRLVLVLSGGKVFALDGICPHRGGPLAAGYVADGNLYCPWHAWGFNLETGLYAGSPGVGLRTYATEVRDGVVYVLR